MLARRLLIVGTGGSFSGPPVDVGEVVHLTESPEGGWSFPTYPKAVYHNGNTYLGYVHLGTGAITIGRYRHSDGDWATTVLDTPTADDHNNPAILIRASDSRILVAFSAHGGSNVYTMLSTNPEDISAWGSATSRDSTNGHTYPALVQLTDVASDPIYLLWRDNTAGSNPSQTGKLVYRKSTDGGSTWGSPVSLYTGASTFMPYWSLTADGSEIHVLATDRDPYASDGGTLALGHFYLDGSDDSRHESDGTTIAASLPLVIGDITEVYDGSAGECFPLDLMMVSGAPRGTFVVYGGATSTGQYARWTGSAWVLSEVFSATSFPIDRFYGALVINRADTSEVFAGQYASASASELYRFTSPDDGATWDPGDAITSGSSDLNMGPVAVVNGVEAIPVFWLQGGTNLTSSGIRVLVR